MNRNKVFIGVAWPYVNGELHIGHLAGYLVPADITARFFRYIGSDVLMVSGSDCHGTPITVEAEEKNISPQQVVDLYHPKHKELFDLYHLSFDIYTETTTDNHRKVVQDMFVKLAENGYIIKKSSLQFYSPREERFLPDRYVKGECPHCNCEHACGDQCDRCGRILEPSEIIDPRSKLSGQPVELKETEHYYLDLPQFSSFLEEYVQDKRGEWRDWVYNETQGWLREGLKARCITRDLDWGIKIPVDRLPEDLQIDNAENKRVYVWFEAVIGYLSASIEWDEQRWKEFWYNESAQHYYFMGKDNLVFHTLFWPCQLHGFDADIHLPDYPVINHFLNVEQKQLSKSRNIIIDSRYIGEKYGVDPVRFYLTLINPEKADTHFSWEHFVEVNNNILIGTIGNFINRVLKLAPDSFDSISIDQQLKEKLEEYLEQVKHQLVQSEFRAYIRSVIDMAKYGNQYFSQKEPWKLDRDSSEFEQVMANMILTVLAINLVWRPVVPGSARRLESILGTEIEKWPLEEPLDYLVDLLSQVNIQEVKPLFDKISPSIVEKEREKLDL